MSCKDLGGVWIHVAHVSHTVSHPGELPSWVIRVKVLSLLPLSHAQSMSFTQNKKWTVNGPEKQSCFYQLRVCVWILVVYPYTKWCLLNWSLKKLALALPWWLRDKTPTMHSVSEWWLACTGSVYSLDSYNLSHYLHACSEVNFIGRQEGFQCWLELDRIHDFHFQPKKPNAWPK